jgi:hypothetical protein
MFDFRDNPAGKYMVHKLARCRDLEEEFGEMEISIGDMWEIRNGELMLVCVTN